MNQKGSEERARGDPDDTEPNALENQIAEMERYLTSVIAKAAKANCTASTLATTLGAGA